MNSEKERTHFVMVLINKSEEKIMHRWQRLRIEKKELLD